MSPEKILLGRMCVALNSAIHRNVIWQISTCIADKRMIHSATLGDI